jgi:hypothetical protein
MDYSIMDYADHCTEEKAQTLSPQTARRRENSKLYRPSGSFPFPPVRGKTVADVYVTTESDLNCVTLCFDDTPS